MSTFNIEKAFSSKEARRIQKRYKTVQKSKTYELLFGSLFAFASPVTVYFALQNFSEETQFYASTIVLIGLIACLFYYSGEHIDKPVNYYAKNLTGNWCMSNTRTWSECKIYDRKVSEAELKALKSYFDQCPEIKGYVQQVIKQNRKLLYIEYVQLKHHYETSCLKALKSL